MPRARSGDDADRRRLAFVDRFEGSEVILLSGEEGLQQILDDPAVEAIVNILPTHVALQVSFNLRIIECGGQMAKI